MESIKKYKSKNYEIPQVGSIFEYWTIVDNIPQYTESGKTWKVLCKCKCGNEQMVRITALLRGDSKGCKCRNVEKIKEKVQAVGELSPWKFGRIRKNALARDLEFSIDMKYLWNLYVSQNGKCALSGIELILQKSLKEAGGREITMASLDRIDSGKGYIEGNLQWVYADINKMKRDFTDEYFINLCKSVAKFNKNESGK